MEKNKQKKSFLISAAVFALFSIIFSLIYFTGVILADVTDEATISVTAVVPPENTIIFSGKACPSCRAYLKQDGVQVLSDICNSSAEFQITREDIPAGTYLFEIYAIDTEGVYSNTSSFTLTISQGTLTTVSDILISPTLQSNESSITEGDDITFFGQTVPSSVVTILIDGSSPFIQVNSASDGEFYYIFDSSSLSVDSHSAEARVTDGGIISPYSLPVDFTVEEEEEEAEEAEEDTCGKADYSGDDKVNLIDFSILIYWFDRQNPPSDIDLYEDDRTNLKDFSILMYCWDE